MRAPPLLQEPTECQRTVASNGTIVSEVENERLGLVCFGKAARYVCPRDDGTDCRDRFRVLVNESGEPLESQFRQARQCVGETLLHGCNRTKGEEVIPFVHTSPIEFTPSGFALVAEEYRKDKQQGGYFYVDSQYEQKLEASTLDGIPEAWLPLQVVRYQKDRKIGFLNLQRGIVTPPIFDSAFRFELGEGSALVCEGCHPMRWNECAPPEAHCSGNAYLIDEQGKRLREKPAETYVEYWWCQRRRPGETFIDASACE